MGDTSCSSSALINLLLTERLEEVNISPFQRFSTNLRKSFNKLTSLRSRYSIEDKRTTGVMGPQLRRLLKEEGCPASNNKGSEDRESLDSGVETDENSEVGAEGRHSLLSPTTAEVSIVLQPDIEDRLSLPQAASTGDSASDENSEAAEDGFLSVEAPSCRVRANALSPLVEAEDCSRSTSEGSAGNRLPSGCLVTRRSATSSQFPKKKVSIRLPEECSWSAAAIAPPPPPPVDLRVVRVQVLDPKDHGRSGASASIAAALDSKSSHHSLLVSAQRELSQRVEPELCDTVELVFQPRAAAVNYLSGLGGEDLWQLLLHLELLLFKHLPVDVPYFETSLFMMHTFLVGLSTAVEFLAGFDNFAGYFLGLVGRCQRSSYADHALCLSETRELFIVFERALLGHLAANPDMVLPTQLPIRDTGLPSANPNPGFQSANSNSGFLSANLNTGLQLANHPTVIKSSSSISMVGMESAKPGTVSKLPAVNSKSELANPRTALSPTNESAGAQSVSANPWSKLPRGNPKIDQQSPLSLRTALKKTTYQI